MPHTLHKFLARVNTSYCHTMLQAIEANPMSSTSRISGRLDNSLSSVLCHLHKLEKESKAAKLCHPV